MFRNYLTYQFAVGFDRDCSILDLPTGPKVDLKRCSQCMVTHLHRALASTTQTDRAKSLFVALTYLKDCKEILDGANVRARGILSRHDVLEARLARMIETEAEGERGQLRMLG